VSDIASLPRDPDILIGMIVDLRDENDKLRAIVETFKRTLFGARSEKLDADAAQLPLALDDVSTAPREPDPEQETRQPRARPGGGKPARNIGGLPKHLPREVVVIEPEGEACPCCQGALHRIGEDVTEMLDIIPAIIRVKRIHRPRYGCRACEGAVVQAPAPARPVEGGLPTTALLAHVAAAKFAWHLPLNRQAQMLAGHGIDLDRSTLVRWIERTVWWLEPLYALLVSTVMSAPKVFCDDTPLPVLDRTRRRTRIARLWTSYGLSSAKLRSRAVHRRATTRPRLQRSTVLVPSRTLTRRRAAPVPLRGILDRTCARRSAIGRSGQRNVVLSRTKE
jgi:transposase